MSENDLDTRDGKNWERDALERVAMAAVNEQRRARRWGIFFKLFFALYLLAVLAATQAPKWGDAGIAKRHTALVELEGVIESEGKASADNVISGLRAAFESTNAAGVILRANSPGGSPVQSAYINNEIARLRDKYPDKPLYAVVGDICASGCYYVVAAADKIYANEASLVGSIGVLMDGFGFVDSLKKLGVERRLITAGENKAFLDPFSPMNAKHQRYIESLLKEIHTQFIDTVKRGRGDALKDDKELFSGLVWSGERAKGLGLIDEMGSASYVAREVIGAEDIVDYSLKADFFDRFAEQLGTATAKALGGQLANRTPLMR